MSDWAERMTVLMRQQGAVLNARGIQLAVMTGPTSLSLGNLALTAEDLLFSAHLLQPGCTKVAGTCPADGGALTDASTYLPALAAGDTVAVIQLSDSRFWVIEKVVTV